MRPSKPIPTTSVNSSEYHKLLKVAIERYDDATWHLAKTLQLGKELFGRNQLLEITPLPINKVKWLLGIASILRNKSLLAEHHAEVMGLTDNQRWLAKAAQENLCPVELRKLIRSTLKKVKSNKSVKIPKWSTKFAEIEREMRNLSMPQQRRIADYIRSKL